MPQSLSQIYIHCVFSTKGGVKLIEGRFRNDLHAYIVGALKNLGAYVIELYANPEHIHILCTLPRTLTVAELISKVKTSSSKWIKKQVVERFSWQNGYGTFSVSQSRLGAVSQYIINQPEKHKQKSFKDEYREFLKEYNVEFEERFVWD